FIYGYSLAADLTPETRYDQLVEAVGGRGELVRDPAAFRPALEKALSTGGGPTLRTVHPEPPTKSPRTATRG
ncbi:MAG: hypothetical protein AAGC46_07580, partial [Solirubrobacteraceae bacterium]|nr:hypothetical protein [Patulibacter sp.]